MRHLFSLPVAGLAGAVALASLALAVYPGVGPLSELEIGLIAWAVVLSIFGLQGLVSYVLDGPEPRPGTRAPDPSPSLGILISVGCVLLIGMAAVLAAAILRGQAVALIGLSAGAGCLLLVLILGAYKQAFLGDEVRVETRQDGIPW